MPYPEKLGQPCWPPEQVRKVISLTAHTSAESAPYFLAAHSPFERIIDAKSSERQLTEEQVFRDLFSPARGEIQAFVKGEPGTGKSHLIRWLKLRAEHARTHDDAELKDFTIVLVSRGNGSLKDALGQVVSQLGKKFGHHIARISGAIERLSDHAARDTLLSALALEVGTHWSSRHPEMPLPNALQHLAAALGPTTGFGSWIKRDGGVIHRVIKRLTEDSSVEDREEFPEFISADFIVDTTYLRPNTTPLNVTMLAEDLEEEEDRRELAANILNLALKDAVRGLTGLKSSDLFEIFTEIRRELGPKKELAVFIEDVSVTGIDQDIINAFEPRAVDGLSRMVAILGITNRAWEGFPDNQKQRASFVYEVGGQVAERWANDTRSVNTFTARYLNAVRMEDDEIEAVAVSRFSGDILRSKCEACPHQVKCFATFGTAKLDNGVTIGLFPLNPNAPKALLAALIEIYYKSQRGLLDRVLLPALDQSYSSLLTKAYPQQNQFSVRAPSPKFDWSAFTARYLGGVRWNNAEKARLRFLVGYWTDASTVDEAGSKIGPFLGPLGFPIFSSEVAPILDAPTKEEPNAPVVVLPVAEDAVLTGLLNSLDDWSSGSKLSQDTEFRTLLGKFLRNSIAWNDQRGTPISVTKRSPEQLVTGYAFVRIQEQVSRPVAQAFFIDFARNSETKELLEALASFERRGRNWNFAHSEIHKRKLSRWLKTNQSRIVASLQPSPVALVEKSRNCAIQILALTACLRERSKIPTNAAERVETLFAPLWNEESKPTVLSTSMKQIMADLEAKHASIRSFVIREFGAGQGDAEPKDFIDPSPMLSELEDFSDSFKVEPPPAEVSGSFWKSRFSSVSRLESYASLDERFQKERLTIQEAVDEVRKFVVEAGFKADNIREDLQLCLNDLVEVIGLQRGGQHKKKAILVLPNEEFDQLWVRKLLQSSDTRSSWAVAVGKGTEVSSDNDTSNLLSFDPAKLKECLDSLVIVKKFLELIDKNMSYEEGVEESEGDSRKQLLDRLKQIEELSASEANEKGTE